MSQYLAFDYGQRRIGTAIGDRLTGAARPLATIAQHSQPDWAAIDRLIADWRPAALIVGLPLDEDGGEQPITEPARRFARQLEARTRLPVHLADERYSSRAADDALRSARASGAMNRRVRKGDRDGEAARIILEQWMAEQPG
ncbi:putative holliday junction resolvase [Hydrocarboniphaga daqingensis]|uniref:Putative pre-16S rRNA nuclease n=1 Tax=Hydrocarboniphaga daqingensis TaxID=490188 RepID=A0A1M5RAK4_9GAMM|nr:putative holliday junction resolvase [Hydrocarboniphaga daqingensis]